MRGGNLKEYIVVKSLKVITNEFGEEERNEYCDKIKIRCEVQHEKGNREIDGDEVFHTYPKTFVVWSYNDPLIDDNDLIYYKSNSYRIITRDIDMTNHILYLTTEKINE